MLCYQRSHRFAGCTTKQRGHGEGSIYKRDDGRWAGAISLANGKRRYFYGRTRQEVSTQLKKALHEQEQGLLVTGPSQTVAQYLYLPRWLEDCARQRVRPRTFDCYSLSVRRILPHIGKVRLSALTPAHVQACYAALLDGGLSRRSVELDHAVLHSALKQAVQWNLIGRNPTEAVSVPRPMRKEMTTLTAEQVQLLFETTREDRLSALWVVLITTGLRLGEASGIQWDDLDVATGRLTVQRAIQRRQGVGLVFVEPKSERSRRTVHLAPGTCAALRQHRARQAAERLAAGPLWQDNHLVFCTEMGAPLSPSMVEKGLHRALAAADLPRIRVHDLRHTAATLLLASGTHPKKRPVLAS